MKSFVSYQEWKKKELSIVHKFKPAYIETYIEPFAGGAAVYRNIPAKSYVINDISGDWAFFHLCIRDQDEKFLRTLYELDWLWKIVETDRELESSIIDFKHFGEYRKEAYSSLPNAIVKEGEVYRLTKKRSVTARKTALYNCIRDKYNECSLKQSASVAFFYFLREYCNPVRFHFNRDGIFTAPYGGIEWNYRYIAKQIDDMQSAENVRRYQNTMVYNCEVEGCLDNYKLSKNDFIFLDPPYKGDFCTCESGTFKEKDFIRLADRLRETDAKWVLVADKDEFMYDIYRDFYIYEYDKICSLEHREGRERLKRRLLISDYPIIGTNE